MKYYLNRLTGKIGQYNGVSDSVLSTTLNVPNKYIELNEEQIARIGNGSITYIITGAEIPKTLEQLKSEKLAELETNYKTALSAGYEYNSNTFNLDDNTKQNISDWIAFLVLEPNLNEFKITDNSFNQVSMDKSQFVAFGAGFGIALSTIKAKYANCRNLISLAQNETELNNVNITF